MSVTVEELKRTPLHGLHLELGGRMVPFAGYALPVQYPAGIMAEHRQVRSAAGLFDVSHMGQVTITDAGDGADAAAALEALVPADVQNLSPGRSRYSFFTNAAGGILDDLMITRSEDGLSVVVNAACKAADFAHLRAGLAGRAEARMDETAGLLALQGPAASEVLGRLAPEVAGMAFMTRIEVELEGAPCQVSRAGYTGEDGYEIAVPGAAAEALAKRLLAEPEVGPVGLGARDSLRLEAGLCLYGQDIDETTTPVEAGLTWAIQKRRREEGGFPGAEVIRRQLAEGLTLRRVGLRPEGRVPVREGAALQDAEGAAVGRVTSGGFGPSVGAPVAMGYLDTRLAAPGAVVTALVRGRAMPCRVAKLPFAPHRYYRG
ncbi:MAG: glycine cleavage system aminomethyltransferase GcvT [Kiloniellales bacterium]|nr:glycine cleavage system aminomethyltransferase GcvT [Kiloniellales bacterium]